MPSAESRQSLSRVKNGKPLQTDGSAPSETVSVLPDEGPRAAGHFGECSSKGPVSGGSERQFRALLENVPNIAVQGYDRHRRVVFWNAASEALYGYTQAEALGRRLEDLIIPPEMRTGVIAAVAGFVERDEQIPASELVLRRKDGRPVYVYSSHAKLYRADGEPELYCIDIDIAARKAAECALAEAYGFHLRLLSHAPALIWRSDRDGKCDWFNDTWLSFTGRALDQETGVAWSLGVHPDDRESCLSTFAHAFAARQPFERDYRMRRNDGEYRWISDKGIPFTSASGEFAGYIGYCFDVTEKRRADEQIREQAALLNVAGDAIFVTSLDGVVTFWNRGAEMMYGIPGAEALGRRFEDLVYRSVSPTFRAGWAELLLSGEWAGEEKQYARSGTLMDVRARGTLMRDAAGRAVSVLLLISDITESKRLETQFLRSQRLESVGALASGVAHDLRNVLTPILMSVELLRPLARTKHDREILQLLSDSAHRGADIIQQLLLFGRGGEVCRTSVDVGEVIRDVGRLMRETFPKDITLSVQAPADLRQVLADRTQIQQVVLNLCVNARDAMPAGGRLTLSAENVEVDPAFAAAHRGKHSGPHVRIKVRDTGTGIRPELLDKIFDPFFTTKPTGQGTGLGLATALGIVRRHEGIIDVQSESGRGSTFQVFLPAAGTDGERNDTPAQRTDLNGRGELILVIDDEDGIRNLLERALRSANYRVLTAANGAEAVAAFSRTSATVNLVVTDLMMPVMDGTRAVRALRLLNPNLPVVAISAVHKEQRAAMEDVPGPAVRFLAKPFTTEHALREIRQALDECARTISPDEPRPPNE